MRVNSEINVIATVFAVCPDGGKGEAIRKLAFSGRVPTLLIYWPSSNPLLKAKYGSTPRFFVADTRTILSGLRGERDGLEYVEVHQSDIRDVASCEVVS